MNPFISHVRTKYISESINMMRQKPTAVIVDGDFPELQTREAVADHDIRELVQCCRATNRRIGVIMWMVGMIALFHIGVLLLGVAPARAVHSAAVHYSPVLDGPLSPANISAGVSDGLSIMQNGRIASERSLPIVSNVLDVSNTVHRILGGGSDESPAVVNEKSPAVVNGKSPADPSAPSPKNPSPTDSTDADPSMMDILKEKVAHLDLTPVLNFLDFVREIEWKKAIATRFDRAFTNIEIIEGTIQALMKGVGSASTQITKEAIGAVVQGALDNTEL